MNWLLRWISPKRCRLDEEVRQMRGSLADALVKNDRKAVDLRTMLAEKALREIVADRRDVHK